GALGERAPRGRDLHPDFRGPLDGEIAQDRVRFPLRDAFENARVLQLLDGDPAYVRVGIAARYGPEAIPLVAAHVLDRRGTHGRVGMTPSGPESSDQVHGFGSGLPTLLYYGRRIGAQRIA